MNTKNSGFGQKTIPLSPTYREFILYAGTTGCLPEYDEETETMKIIFTEMPAFHKISAPLPEDTDLGTAKFSIVLQKPEQFHQLAKLIQACAVGFECLLDPDYQYHEELMGR